MSKDYLVLCHSLADCFQSVHTSCQPVSLMCIPALSNIPQMQRLKTCVHCGSIAVHTYYNQLIMQGIYANLEHHYLVLGGREREIWGYGDQFVAKFTSYKIKTQKETDIVVKYICTHLSGRLHSCGRSSFLPVFGVELEQTPMNLKLFVGGQVKLKNSTA